MCLRNIYWSRLDTTCDPIVIWIWYENSLSFSLLNIKVMLVMEGWVVLVDSILLLARHKHKFIEKNHEKIF
jgi:hypothetical protein